MSYQLDLEEIKSSFDFDGGIKHNPRKRTRFLPYTTNFNDNKQFKVKEAIGEFSRLIAGKKLSNEIKKEDLIDAVMKKVDFQNDSQRQKFNSLLKSLFFSEGDQLYLFHPDVMYYIVTEGENKKFAEFLYSVLWDKNTVGEVGINRQPHDVLTKLLFDSLPSLQNLKTVNEQTFHGILPNVSELFMSDYKWLARNPQLFVDHFEKLLSFYYFFYVSHFALTCDAMFKAGGVTPIYFTVEWESLSQTRSSYEGGWKYLEPMISRLFTHVNGLEFLNHSTDPSLPVYSYLQIRDQLNALSEEELGVFEKQLDQLTEEYRLRLDGDVHWDDLQITGKPYESNPVLNKIFIFVHMIDFQFLNIKTGRKSRYYDYQKWFVQFCQTTFLKTRGRLGKTLNLNADYLLFLTKLIIKDESKIRLKHLFDEFKRRGVLFDRDTQAAIIQYFEIINILEKKSDSGDALYVKAFL